MPANCPQCNAELNADLTGVYDISLTVSDFIGPGSPDSVLITVTTAEGFAEVVIVDVGNIVTQLDPDLDEVTNSGNQNALFNFITQALLAVQEGNISKAIDKLEKALIRTDGCVLRGEPDPEGQGRDWIIDCTAQIEAYGLLTSALAASNR